MFVCACVGQQMKGQPNRATRILCQDTSSHPNHPNPLQPSPRTPRTCPNYLVCISCASVDTIVAVSYGFAAGRLPPTEKLQLHTHLPLLNCPTTNTKWPFHLFLWWPLPFEPFPIYPPSRPFLAIKNSSLDSTFLRQQMLVTTTQRGFLVAG